MDYVQNLERIIRQMLRPLKDVPFGLVIEAISQQKVLQFDMSQQENLILLGILENAANSAGREINKKGILTKRATEVGNAIESFVKAALNKEGLKAATPMTSQGRKKAMGYPNIEFTDKAGRTNYLECKTFNSNNISTTQRSFCLSPSEDFKVTKDGFHFLLAYEVIMDGREANINICKCKRFKVLSLENLLVDVKYEFNSDNKRLYKARMLVEKSF